MDSKDLYYPVQAFVKATNAAVKPSIDFEDVLSSIGAKGIGMHRAFYPNLKVVHLRNILHSFIVKYQLPKNKVVVLQYPMQYHIREVFHAAKKLGNKIIVIIHDINWLRDKDVYNFDDVLSGADVIIAHTPAMKSWLKNRYSKPEIVVLDVFDYIQHDIPDARVADDEYSIVFAGNLEKSSFLQKLNLTDTKGKLILYGAGCPEDLASKSFVDYKGCCMPEEIPSCIAPYGFGLVWDGMSTDTCDGGFGKYLQYNAPYKLSSYIAAGLPVIVWDKMGIADFVKSNGIGIALSSLENLGKVLSELSKSEYNHMRENTKSVQAKVSSGYFARRALEEAISKFN